jgi:hypothetical protein
VCWNAKARENAASTAKEEYDDSVERSPSISGYNEGSRDPHSDMNLDAIDSDVFME